MVPLILVFGFSVETSVAQNSSLAKFDEANNLLETDDYRQALAAYKSISHQNISGGLFLNMAISYVQLDSLGKAKYYFLKARQFDETRERAEDGLQFVESRFSRQSAVLPKLPWERFFDWLGTQISVTNLLGLGLLLLNLGVCAYVGTWFFAYFRKPMRYGGIGIAAISLLIILSSFYLKHLQNRYSSAVMIHQQASVLEQPENEATMVSQAYEGYTFTVDHARSRNEQGWSYVRMSNGLYGWVPTDNIMVL
ncbi:MAG: hypothetical protein U5K69_27720 [Balneolaceae bacterium]|nr:hypothetical protein [Balneolaceae bacterium]